ncbi:MAG TPA: D-cysteine desulfhydrase family protein [Anaerolineaceae bacterium]|nr:D-cysteine desulfhydrase family protein [Anaerolineaceae bacterium]
MIPRVRFAILPTPVESLPRLSTALEGPHLWVKRDDMTGLAFGGNKTRKLEFVMAEVQANGARTLITVGAAQSNHCRQTAAMAARFGLDCILVLSGDPSVNISGNVLIDRLFHAEIVWTNRNERSKVLEKTFDRAWSEGRRPYLIPLGASNATGALAYADAFNELMQQHVNPDWIVHASSSGGTQAGLLLGARRTRWQGKILGISVDNPAQELKTTVAALASEASERLGDMILFNPEDVLVNDDYLGAGYGVMGDLERHAIRLFAQQEGLLLDPVYTGRAAGGLIDLIQKGFFKHEETVLFWHTGGTPALFAEPYFNQLNNF